MAHWMGGRTGLLPHDKSAAVAELGRTAGPVAMVGDGINYAPRSPSPTSASQ